MWWYDAPGGYEMKETDLYQPVKSYLETQGYSVKGEVQDCDVVAVKEDITIIVELKTAINLTLLLQAVERKGFTDDVYIAVPNSGTILKKQYRQVIRLLKLLGIGLLLVNPSDLRVDSVLDPCEYKPQKRKKKKARLLKEHADLVGDPNTGGSTKTSGRMTAYRQKALAIAGYIISNGPTKASEIKDALNEPKARDILYRNVYSWFERQGKGVYSISPQGTDEHSHWTKS
jgi:hypothetical protein